MMNILVKILLSVILFVSCSIPSSQTSLQGQKHYKDLQLKIRIIGSTPPGAPWPAFTQHGQYPNTLQYIWYANGSLTDSNNYITFQTWNGDKGYTSGSGRNLFIDYHTDTRMMIKYDGSATTHRTHIALLKGPLVFGREIINLPIPAGLDPEKEIAVLTIYYDHEVYQLTPTITSLRAKITVQNENPEPKIIIAQD